MQTINMNGGQIEHVLMNNHITRVKFKGVFNKKTLPIIYSLKKYVIVNTSSNVNEMGHWILFIFNFNKLLFIDSLGKSPEVYGDKIEEYYHSFNGEKAILLKNPLQTDSSLVCGAYVIYFSFFL